MTDYTEYWTDAVQRTVLFTDILRKRGNTYLDHLEKDQPSVLAFDCEMVMDGRSFERSANCSLVRIMDRWSKPSPGKGKSKRQAYGSGVNSNSRRCAGAMPSDREM